LLSDVHFAEPSWLILLILSPLPFWRERSRPRLRWPSLNGFAKAPKALAGWARHFPALLRAAAICCLAVAMARPQTVGGQVRVAGRGVAIVVALDRSRSMLAQDFPSRDTKISRLDAAKETLERFIAGRSDDLVGLIAFANYPKRVCAPTLDHRHLIETTRVIQSATPGEDGTNIGHAMVRALGDLQGCPPARKVLVLITDGEDRPAVPNPIDPRRAAELARDLGITVHTIAIGRPAGQVREREKQTGLDLVGETSGPNLALLGELAKIGGGRSFSAADSDSLQEVFGVIDGLEKSPVRGTVWTRYHEEYAPWVVAAILILAFDRLVVVGRFRRLP
jgi:Ca-activated chloride channel homolog